MDERYSFILWTDKINLGQRNENGMKSWREIDLEWIDLCLMVLGIVLIIDAFFITIRFQALKCIGIPVLM